MIYKEDITTFKKRYCLSYKKYNSKSVNKQEKVMYNGLQTELLTIYAYIHSRLCLFFKQIHLCLRATGLNHSYSITKRKNLTKYTDFCSGLETFNVSTYK